MSFFVNSCDKKSIALAKEPYSRQYKKRLKEGVFVYLLEITATQASTDSIYKKNTRSFKDDSKPRSHIMLCMNEVAL
jgi:hypothetical protein